MDKQSITILVVEDDEAMLLGISDLLEIMDVDGYEVEVLTAENGAIALERMDECTPDLIISDINMPIMDGYAFFDAVRQHSEWLYIPFIFLTAQGDRKEIHRGQISGVDLYLTKPFNSIYLVELVKTQLDKAAGRRARREREGKNLKEGILKILNHEFRTPLTYVTASYEMLAESVSMHTDDQHFQDYLRGIQAGCIRLTHLVEELILVIELRTGELQTRYQQEVCIVDDITAVITPIIQQQQALHHTKDTPAVHINVNTDENLPPIAAVPAYLTQIVDQLLTNAIKFTHTDDNQDIHVTLSVTANDTELEISVRDEGIGIPDRVKSQIFDVFYQHNREYMEQQGAGVGLTIVEGLVQLHGGYVDVESVEGEGSTFTAVFPTSSAHEINYPLETAVYQRKVNILVVEDDVYLLRGLVDLLEIYSNKYDITVFSAGNGRLALDILENNPLTLILSDIMMPVMDGYALLNAVRENPAWIDIPFIFLTARSEREDIFQGLQSGAEVYITKPYDSDELIALVESELDKFFHRQREQMQGFDELKRNILSLISLDFRTPLADVSRHSESLSQQLADAQTEENMKKSLRGIQAGNDLLTQLIENFIALAELKTGETAAAYQLRAYPIFNVGMYFYDAINSHHALAATRRIPCFPITVQEIPAVYGDATLLRELFRRLMSIGLNYFPAGDDVLDGQQELHQQLTHNATNIQLSIHFTVAPSAEMQASITHILTDYEFEPTNQIDYAPDLVIAKGYTELNNGRLHTSTQNGGYTFIITLPIYTIPAYNEFFTP